MRIAFINPRFPHLKVSRPIKALMHESSSFTKLKIKNIREQFGFDFRSSFLVEKENPISVALLSLASFLEEKGYECDYFQQSLYPAKAWKKTLRRIAKNYEVVCISSFTFNFPLVIQEIVKPLKELNESILVIGGGYHMSFCDEESIRKGFDIIVRGEGEKTLWEVVKSVESGKIDKLAKISNISYKFGNTIRRNRQCLCSIELDKLPPPAYHLLPRQLRKNPNLCLFISRGCPYRCKYCAEGNFWQSFRRKSIKKIVEDVSTFLSECKTNMIFFGDSTFNLDEKYALTVLRVLKREFPDIYFAANIRISLMNSFAAREFFKNNLRIIFAGIESADSLILKVVKRNETPRGMLQGIKNCSRFPFVVNLSYIVGLPGENRTSINITKRFINQTYRYFTTPNLFSSVRVFVPYPGTPIFERPDLFGLKIFHKNWEEYHRYAKPVFELKGFKRIKIWEAFIELWRFVLEKEKGQLQ